jgi:hypothetical protein
MTSVQYSGMDIAEEDTVAWIECRLGSSGAAQVQGNAAKKAL